MALPLFSDKDSLSNSCVSKIVWSDSDTLVTGFEFFSQDDFDQRVGIRVFKDEKDFNSIDQIDDAIQLVDLRADPTDSNIIWVLTANSASKGKLSRLSISTNVIEPILDNLDSPQAFALSEDSLCVIETTGRRNSKLSFHAKEKSKEILTHAFCKMFSFPTWTFPPNPILLSLLVVNWAVKKWDKIRSWKIFSWLLFHQLQKVNQKVIGR